MNSRDRQFWTEFLRLYRSVPAVWKVKSPEYSSRALKTAGYEKLVRKLREVEPDADRALVIKKINSFRTNFRRDLRKRNNNVDDEPFESTLWYFSLLSFLEGQEDNNACPSLGRSSPCRSAEEHSAEPEEEEEEEEEEHIQDEPVLFFPTYDAPPKKKRKVIKEEASSPASRMLSESPHASGSIAASQRREHKARMEYKKMRQRQSAMAEADSLAHTWSAQYNELSVRQKVLARKLISDVLYYGCMHQLDPSHVTQLQDMMLRNSSSPLIEDVSASPRTRKMHYMEDYDEAVDAD